MKLARAIIFVEDLARMTEFYRDGMLLEVRAEEPGWVELDGVALHAIPNAILAGITIDDPPRPRADTPIKLVFVAPHLGAARAHLIASGAQMGEVKDWGACDGVDPEGNVFQIVPAASE